MTQEQIEQRIQKAYPDGQVAVMDLTGGGDHWEVRVLSSQFAGKSRIVQHKEIMGLFAEELKTGEIHALSIKTFTKQ